MKIFKINKDDIVTKILYFTQNFIILNFGNKIVTLKF